MWKVERAKASDEKSVSNNICLSRLSFLEQEAYAIALVDLLAGSYVIRHSQHILNICFHLSFMLSLFRYLSVLFSGMGNDLNKIETVVWLQDKKWVLNLFEMAEKSEFCGMMSYGNFETLDSCLSSPLVTISGQSNPLIIGWRSSLFHMHPALLKCAISSLCRSKAECRRNTQYWVRAGVVHKLSFSLLP